MKDNQGKLSSKLYSKPTVVFPLLNYKFNHPPSTKFSIIYSQAQRYRLVTTNDTELNKELTKLQGIFLARGYPHNLVNQKIHEATDNITQNDLLHEKTQLKTHTSNILPFIIPFDTNFLKIKKILMKHWHLIKLDPELTEVFPNPPFLAFERTTNIKDHLVHTRF